MGRLPLLLAAVGDESGKFSMLLLVAAIGFVLFVAKQCLPGQVLSCGYGKAAALYLGYILEVGGPIGNLTSLVDDLISEMLSCTAISALAGGEG